MKIIQEIKDFAVKGNVVDMAVGIVIGGAFTSIVKSIVSDIINPVVGLLTNGVDLTNIFVVLKGGTKGTAYTTLAQATSDGAVTLNIGQLCNNIISFVIVAIILFFIIKAINKLKTQPEQLKTETPTTKNCPFCYSTIHIAASKCPNCTSLVRDKKFREPQKTHKTQKL
jgi:large conductance mechanosensitive channel